MNNGYDQFFKKRKRVLAGKKSGRFSRLGSSQIWMILLATAMAGGSAFYLWAGDQPISGYLSKIEVSVFGEALAEGGSDTDKGSAKNAENLPKSEEKQSKDGFPDSPKAATPKRSWSDEEIALFTKLEARKQTLDAKEAELVKLEEELQKQKEGLEKRLAALEEVRGKIAAKLEDRVKVDQQRVEALVSVYANMKPVQAAKVIEGINEDLAIEVLSKMKNKSAAEILNLMDPEKAKKLSEHFAGFREPATTGN